ncbi:type II toxin-antitoxin system RelE/ParE family toxin [Limosilactobacillus caccae]|uniref:type II toxin-antitoxin system RelE/ParE family toxin n=1 Tax=Limosilactobacillus caccae TaxID=1926284 RepID=UPI0009709DD0|nr:type II toxin-antitoxin system RelE/ParE family toxin [Limosilactobacillus caccae]
MEIKYTSYFAKSLTQIINYWTSTLKLNSEQVNSFVFHIYQKLELLKSFPRMGQDVTQKYQFQETTYRLLIGKSYGIFYRFDEEKSLIIVGSIYGTSQVKVKF